MTGEHILVVDDDENLRYLMSLTLKREGYRVDTAQNGADALEKIQTAGADSYHVLVTDQMMPVLGGIELLKKAKELDPFLEVIIITAAGTLRSAISALRGSGAFDYLLKPIASMSQLLDPVKNACAHRKLLLEHKSLQDQVQIEAQRLKSVIACSGHAILFGDEQDILKIANPEAQNLFGRSDLVGQPAQNCLPPPLLSLFKDWKAMGQSSPVSQEIIWEGDIVMMVNFTPVSEDKTTTQGWVLTLRDMTPLRDFDRLKTEIMNSLTDHIQQPLAQSTNYLSELNQLTADYPQLAGLVNQLMQTCRQVENRVEELRRQIQTNFTER